jgi:hypothetical protein
MNGLIRFISLGAEDADRRIAAALTPRPLEPVDQYLRTSAIVAAIDRATARLAAWWSASEAYRLWSAVDQNVGKEPVARYRAVAFALLIAVSLNVALTLAQGPRPGWYWLVIPVMAAASAVLLLAGSRSSASSE